MYLSPEDKEYISKAWDRQSFHRPWGEKSATIDNEVALYPRRDAYGQIISTPTEPTSAKLIYKRFVFNWKAILQNINHSSRIDSIDCLLSCLESAFSVKEIESLGPFVTKSNDETYYEFEVEVIMKGETTFYPLKTKDRWKIVLAFNRDDLIHRTPTPEAYSRLFEAMPTVRRRPQSLVGATQQKGGTEEARLATCKTPDTSDSDAVNTDEETSGCNTHGNAVFNVLESSRDMIRDSQYIRKPKKGSKKLNKHPVVVVPPFGWESRQPVTCSSQPKVSTTKKELKPPKYMIIQFGVFSTHVSSYEGADIETLERLLDEAFDCMPDAEPKYAFMSSKQWTAPFGDSSTKWCEAKFKVPLVWSVDGKGTERAMSEDAMILLVRRIVEHNLGYKLERQTDDKKYTYRLDYK